MIEANRISFIARVAMTIIFSITACAALVTPSEASDYADAQGLVDKARITFSEFMGDNQYSWFQQHLKYAKGLLIYPQVIKGGFIIGGSGGTGVLVIKDEKTGQWSQPAFYTIGSVTLGLQIGGEASQLVVLAMSQKAIDSLLSSSFKLGGDVSVALGPVGGGAKENITADFISFAKSKGLYAGLNLEGAVVDVRDSLNSAYYGRNVYPVDIIIKKEVSNEGSKELRETLGMAVK
ncbi:MAG: lipid-binding SYLF domain-containing protein [Dissulfurispiraceae bacterium]|jgi:SH3 domain-containing YSC84-like protein 1